MDRKIGSLLRVVADFHDFCEPDASLSALARPGEELSELDLDLIAAAANIPVQTKPEKDRK